MLFYYRHKNAKIYQGDCRALNICDIFYLDKKKVNDEVYQFVANRKTNT